MDDNKVLTLVSNARIPLKPPMRLLFEVANLENATLATVTRGGVLFINATDIGWKPYMESWLNRDKYRVATEKSKSNNIYKEAIPAQFDQQAFTIYSSLFEKFFATNYRYFQKCSYIAPVNEICQVMATCNIIDALLDEHYQNVVNLPEEDKREAYQRMFLFGAMWGIGGAVGGGENGLRA